MYKKYSKLRKGSSFLLLVVLVIFTMNPITVKGNWSEDFSDNIIPEWVFWARDFGGEDEWDNPLTEHGMYVEDGVLKSDGLTPQQDVFHGACRQIDFVLETYSVDVYNAPNWG